MAELGTGGVDLGAMGQLQGHMPGLHVAAGLATDIGPVLAGAALRRQPAKDYNDGAASTTVGTQNGRKVEDTPKRKVVQWWPNY